MKDFKSQFTTAALSTLLLLGIQQSDFAQSKSKIAMAKPTMQESQSTSQLSQIKLQHVAIRVADFEGTLEWYKSKLGFTEQIRWKAPPYIDPNLQFAYLELNGTVLEVAGGGNPVYYGPKPKSMSEDLQRQGYAHLCFEVEDAQAAMEELKKRGIEIYAGPFTNTTLNRTFFHIKDPNGIWIEFVQILPD